MKPGSKYSFTQDTNLGDMNTAYHGVKIFVFRKILRTILDKIFVYFFTF